MFFHSIFSSIASDTSYPESLIRAAIERAVDGTDPWIRAVSGYKRKLRPAVMQAIDYVVEMVEAMEPPIVIKPDRYDDDSRLRTFFISKADMQKILTRDRNLANFQREQPVAVPQVVALLAMEKHEKIILGAELSGDIVLRDVPQTTVSFEAHRLIDPTGNEHETRRLLKRRVFDHLLSLALRRIIIVKSERDKIERYRALLHSKLNLLRRGGWGFYENVNAEHLEVEEIEDQLDKIETQLLELGGNDQMLEVYLNIVANVLSRPAEHLWARKETLIVDRMGIKRSKAVSDFPEITIDLISNDEGRSLVISLVDLSGDINNDYIRT
jgi:hypothetical protein